MVTLLFLLSPPPNQKNLYKDFMSALLFYLFAGSALLAALMVVRAENPIHSVLFLVVAFVNSAALLLLLEVEFLALLFVVVYVGAIAVLFLFVVMMLEVKMARHSGGGWTYLPLGGLLLLFAFTHLLLLVEGNLVAPLQSEEAVSGLREWYAQVDPVTSLEVIGQVLYTSYFCYFLFASVVLLVAMIGSIVLTLHLQHKVRRQQIFQQVSRDLSSAVLLVQPASSSSDPSKS